MYLSSIPTHRPHKVSFEIPGKDFLSTEKTECEPTSLQAGLTWQCASGRHESCIECVRTLDEVTRLCQPAGND